MSRKAPSVGRELWAYCGVCSRWFFCERSAEPENNRIACPVCSVPSAIFHNRVNGNRHQVSRSTRPA